MPRLGCLIVVASLVGATLAGCRYPRDVDGTLDRARGGVLRVGLVESEPWVKGADGDAPSGIEVALVERFARRIGAEPAYIDGSEEELLSGLKEGTLDVVIGGLTRRSPYKKEVAFTRPYLTTSLVIGVPPGEPTDVKGRRVAYEHGDEAGGLLSGEDAIGVPVEALEDAKGPVAVEDFLLDDLGRRPTGIELQRDRHVMAVRKGENALLVALEEFLLGREDEVRRAVREEGKP